MRRLLALAALAGAAIYPLPSEECTGPSRTALEDWEAEKDAQFGSRTPPALWNQTSFLFAEEPLWSIELILAQDVT